MEEVIRIGIDLTSVEDVGASIAMHGDRYLTRIYGRDELRDCGYPGPVDRRRLAASFAAKEATIKVLQPRDEPVPWRDIALRRTAGGPAVVLAGLASQAAAAAGITTFSISVSSDRDVACAVVIGRSAS